MDDPRAALRLRVVPGLVLICLYLALSLYQNGLVMSLGLEMWRLGSGDFVSFGALIMLLSTVELVAAMAAIASIVLVHRPFVPVLATAALLLCGMPGYWLENVILSSYMPSGRSVIGPMNIWVLLDLALVLAAAVWLLKSRNVRDFFDHSLVARTFD